MYSLSLWDVPVFWAWLIGMESHDPIIWYIYFSTVRLLLIFGELPLLIIFNIVVNIFYVDELVGKKDLF